ncbi:uncharacterized protein LOC143054778 [Mytilus galloprovincialis]|uniref:uncharacterized protein LOC143054778 n=1 Tax=Mytilus galloprovincialis TaxID=29158 RepID=UPI003F7C8A21
MDILLIMIYQMSEIHPCNIEVCLTWSAEHNMIAFRCKVNYLTWKVEFFNQYHREQAYCLSPIPHSECYHLYKNCSITQDAYTNITTLTVRGHIDDSINGKWTCYHGTNLGTASVNVTVLKGEGKSKLGENCWQEFTSWTFVGVISSVAIMHMFYFIRKKMNLFTDTRLEQCLDKYKRHRSIVSTVIGLFFMVIVVILPLVIGVRTSDCKGQHIFIVYGILMVVILVCLRTWNKGSKQIDTKNHELDTFRTNRDDVM